MVSGDDQTAGRYRLLILDGHSSHATASFDQFCTERRIIPLYMPPYSSHLLQPLDISCSAPLKYYYGQKIREMAQNDIHAIDKQVLISIYSSIHGRAFSKSNILSAFSAVGLIPFKPERVLANSISRHRHHLLPHHQPILLFRKNISQSLSVESTEKADSRTSKPISIFSCCRADA